MKWWNNKNLFIQFLDGLGGKTAYQWWTTYCNEDIFRTLESMTYFIIKTLESYDIVYRDYLEEMPFDRVNNDMQFVHATGKFIRHLNGELEWEYEDSEWLQA